MHEGNGAKHIKELRTSILAMDTPIVNLQECNLEEPTPSEEPTHQVMKEMIFDDDCDLNGLNNQYLEDNSSYEKFSWEFEPLEEIEPH